MRWRLCGPHVLRSSAGRGSRDRRPAGATCGTSRPGRPCRAQALRRVATCCSGMFASKAVEGLACLISVTAQPVLAEETGLVERSCAGSRRGAARTDMDTRREFLKRENRSFDRCHSTNRWRRPPWSATGISWRIYPNGVASAINVEVEDPGYGRAMRTVQVPAGCEVVVPIDLAGSHGWYDLRIQVVGVTGCLRRHAGDLETGGESQSDSLMRRASA